MFRVKKDAYINSDKWLPKSFHLTFRILGLTATKFPHQSFLIWWNILFNKTQTKKLNSDFSVSHFNTPSFLCKQRRMVNAIKQLEDGAECASSKFCKSRTYLHKTQIDKCFFNNFLYLLVNSDTAIASMTSIGNKNIKCKIPL